MTSKQKILCFILAISVLVATPMSWHLSLVAYFFGLPALFLIAAEFKTSYQRAFFFYLFGFLFFLIQMRWMGGARYHGLGIIPAYIVLSALFAYPFAALGYFLPSKLDELKARHICFIGTLFMILEFSRLYILCGFPFHTLGLMLCADSITLQLVSLVGQYGLSFIVIAMSLLSVKGVAKKDYRYLSFSLVPVMVGAMLIERADISRPEGENLTVSMIQPGLRVEQKWDLPGFKGEQISEIEQLKALCDDLLHLSHSDLVLLPESSLALNARDKWIDAEELKSFLPEEAHLFFNDAKKYSVIDFFTKISLFLNTDLMVGLLDAPYNSAFYFSSGELVGRYNKQRLVPLGEYIPFGIFRSIATRYGLDDFFQPGKNKDLIYGATNILPSLCFDEGFPGDFLSKLKMGPKLHVNLSNDAWFIESNLVDHHYTLSVLRSVETGLFTARVSNNGISAIISPTGEIEQKLLEKDEYGEMNHATLVHPIELYTKTTLFSQIGNLGLFIILAILNFVFALLSKRVIILKT